MTLPRRFLLQDGVLPVAPRRVEGARDVLDALHIVAVDEELRTVGDGADGHGCHSSGT